MPIDGRGDALMKYSRQRELIYQWVMEHPIHPTADKVYDALRSKEPKLSLGTVYRNLNLLAETGSLSKIPMPGGSDRFDARTDCHYHLSCTACGKLLDLQLPELANLDRAILERTGWAVSGFQVLCQGLCTSCMSVSKKAARK